MFCAYPRECDELCQKQESPNHWKCPVVYETRSLPSTGSVLLSITQEVNPYPRKCWALYETRSPPLPSVVMRIHITSKIFLIEETIHLYSRIFENNGRKNIINVSLIYYHIWDSFMFDCYLKELHMTTIWRV